MQVISLPQLKTTSHIQAQWCIYVLLNWVIVGLGNGLLSVWHQANTWTNADLLSVRHLGTKLDGIPWYKEFNSRKAFESVICKLLVILFGPQCVNTLRLRQNGCHFPNDTFKWIFLNKKVWIWIQISLKFVPRYPINDIPTLVWIMAWCRPGDKPLSEQMMVNLLMHTCITHRQWVEKSITSCMLACISILIGNYFRERALIPGLYMPWEHTDK